MTLAINQQLSPLPVLVRFIELSSARSVQLDVLNSQLLGLHF